MSRAGATLSQRHSDLTEGVILAAAIDLLEHSSVAELTVREIAKRANISSRTIFRYFPMRSRSSSCWTGTRQQRPRANASWRGRTSASS